MPPPAPKTIGRYAIVERLGQGGMGVVYRAWDPELRRMVALKVISGSREAPIEDQVFERFAREARSAASLAHPNIVTIHDFGRDADGRPYLVMELVDGQSLAQMIHGAPSIDLPRRIALVGELCEGLAYAHAHGVVHRDIKPANLMITASGVLKILDFGLARLTDDLADPALTQSGAVMGTPQYMSPEQVSGLPADARSDIFSVGTVMYELCTGQSAFGGPSAALVRLLILHDSPRPMHEIVPGFPDRLAAIVARAMEKDRSRRYQSLDALAADLEAWVREHGAPDSLDRAAANRAGGDAAGDAATSGEPGLDKFLGEWEDAVGRVLAAPAERDGGDSQLAVSRDRDGHAVSPSKKHARAAAPNRRGLWVAAAVTAAVVAGGLFYAATMTTGRLARPDVDVAQPIAPVRESTEDRQAPQPEAPAPAARPGGAAGDGGGAASKPPDRETPTPAQAPVATSPRPVAATAPAGAQPPAAERVPSPDVAARCTEILQRAGLGEELTARDREFLAQQCRNRSK